MPDIITAFRSQFELDRLTVVETEHWIWSIRPDQVTLGSSIISLRREVCAFAACTQAEFQDLKVICESMESSLKAEFKYDKINYLMLMMRDPLVHFHVFPRYSAQPSFAGSAWPDANWPKPPDIFQTLDDASLSGKIVEALVKVQEEGA